MPCTPYLAWLSPSVRNRAVDRGRFTPQRFIHRGPLRCGNSLFASATLQAIPVFVLAAVSTHGTFHLVQLSASLHATPHSFHQQLWRTSSQSRLVPAHAAATLLQHMTHKIVSLSNHKGLPWRRTRQTMRWLMLLTALQAMIALSAVGAGSASRMACPTGCLNYGTCNEELGRCGHPSFSSWQRLRQLCLPHPALTFELC